VNLALSLARSGIKTLLFFADLRRPRFSNFFKLDPSKPNFSDFLNGKCSLQDVIHRSVMPNLDLIVPGPPIERSESLTSHKLNDLMTWLKSNYEKVLVDSPPLMVGISDTLLLSKVSDGIMVVTCFGKTKIRIFQRGVRRLKEIGIPIFGVVINKVDTRRGHYSYYQDYYLPYKPYRHHHPKSKSEPKK
jgi:tyrosine-protein kinase Etk/Wzc